MIKVAKNFVIYKKESVCFKVIEPDINVVVKALVYLNQLGKGLEVTKVVKVDETFQNSLYG